MQYIILSADNKITAVAEWQFPDSVPAKEEVVRNEEGQFVFKSELDEAHEEEVRLEREKENARAKRDAMLQDTDKFLLPDYPVSADELISIKAYRQELRDLPKQSGFPSNITWPKNPMED